MLSSLIVFFIDVCMVTPNPGGIVAAVAADEAPPDNQSCFISSGLLLNILIAIFALVSSSQSDAFRMMVCVHDSCYYVTYRH